MRFTSFLSPAYLWFYKEIAAYIQRMLGIEASTVASSFYPLEDPDLLNNSIQAAFLCGLPLSLRELEEPGLLRPLVAPVPVNPRYGNAPVYYADVIARREHATFADLQNARFCYNDPGSNSGYNLLRYYLLTNDLLTPEYGYFSQTTMVGSHLRAIEAVRSGAHDCAAIDSGVLEEAMRVDPTLDESIHVVLSVGPSPAPPIVVNNLLDAARIQDMLHALVEMHHDPIMLNVLAKAGFARYAAVTLEDYMPLAHMHREAIRAGVEHIR
jgi:phosphonate transport system substrate-binding protein